MAAAEWWTGWRGEMRQAVVVEAEEGRSEEKRAVRLVWRETMTRAPAQRLPMVQKAMSSRSTKE